MRLGAAARNQTLYIEIQSLIDYASLNVLLQASPSLLFKLPGAPEIDPDCWFASPAAPGDSASLVDLGFL